LIKKSLTIFIILFVLYNLFIELIKPNTIFQDQWHLNRIQAQEYLYENKKIETVIVGTSQSAFLIMDLLPENTYNLAFSGQSAFDGLEIAKKKSQKPDILLIEINNIYTGYSPIFLDNLFLPGIYSARKIFPALRDKYRASCIAEMTLSSTRQYLVENLKKYLSNSTITLLNTLINSKTTAKKADDVQINKENDIRMEPALFEVMLNKMIHQFNEIPEENVMTHTKKVLTDYKNFFEKSGVQIILFEMPVHEKLVHSKKATHIRNMMYEIFPPDRFYYIFPNNVAAYKTTDGVHLTPNSMMEYTACIATHLKKIIWKIKVDQH